MQRLFALFVLASSVGAFSSTVAGACSVKGAVTDLFGHPVSNAVVQVADGVRATTLASGEYILKALADGEVQISAGYPGFHRVERSLALTGCDKGRVYVLDFGLIVGELSDVNPIVVSRVRRTDRLGIRPC